MRIDFFESDNDERTYFEKNLEGHKLFFNNEPLEFSDVRKLAKTEILVVFIYSKITKEIVENMPHLKMIVTLSSGYDHIDLDACREHDVVVVNVPKYGGTAVAEHTFALLLSLIRKIPRAVANTSHDDFSLDGLCGFELAGKTLGVVGAGTIGSAVVRIARAFGMNVLVYERTPNKALENETGAKHASLNELLKKSDVVSLHLPYTKETHHILDRKRIEMMKDGAILINTARGGLVDSKALSDALDSRKIIGAGLDVLEGEIAHKEAHAPKKEHHIKENDWRLIRYTHALLKKPNVIITPHMAFYTKEALHVILESAVNNIKSFVLGKHIEDIAKIK